MGSFTEFRSPRESNSFHAQESGHSADGDLRRLAQRGATSDFHRAFEPHVRRIVRRVLQGGTRQGSAIKGRIGREIRLALREHAGQVARDPSRLVEIVVQRVCRALLQQDGVSGKSQQLLETARF